MASLLGATFGAPVVAFEAPGERMAASRLHLPSPVRTHSITIISLISVLISPQPSTLHITHVLNTADSVAMGVCTGVTSLCALAGYALESKYAPSQISPVSIP